ncbi:MAG: pyridoxal phosphate-dependent aminotransferase [Ignavibacteriales bacterium]|nr:pyridoxal phosphate-dependent aminotransferase [Ignavibacteriales bacterium]
MKSLSRQVAKAEESQTLALSALAKKLQSEGVDVVSLTAGEPDFPTPLHIKQAAIKAIENNFTKYTQNPGIPELRQAIAEKFKRDNGLSFDASQILVSNGAKHSLYNALKAICNRGDEIIIPAPYWVSYPQMVNLVDAKPVIIQTTEKTGFRMTAAQLRRAITKKTKAIILCSPSNPTGSVYSQEEIEALAKVVKETDIYVLSDEIYEKVIYDGATHFSMGSIPAVKDHVITINGVSKAYSMTGWRIGYLGARKDIVVAAEKVQSQTTSNASSISQRAALAALTGGEVELKAMTAEFLKRRDFIHSAITAIQGVTCVKPQGAFYIFPNVSHYFGAKFHGSTIKSCDDIAQFLLHEEKVVLVPGSGFGSKKHLRLSYACSMADLEKAAERIQRGFKKLQ